MKVIIKLSGFISVDEFSGEYKYAAYKMDEYGETTVCPVNHSFETDIPDDFNLILAKISAIDERIGDVQVEAELRINRLKDEKSKLLCLENGVTA